jgi:citrate synthase
VPVGVDHPGQLLRGFALLARTAGLIGQLAEELRRPVANEIFLSVDLNNRSVSPEPYAPEPYTPGPSAPAVDANGGSHG